jgi:hypothetical protein
METISEFLYCTQLNNTCEAVLSFQKYISGVSGPDMEGIFTMRAAYVMTEPLLKFISEPL